jgi:hyaluronan synthase
MFVFLLQLRDTIETHRIYLFTIFIVLVWAIWLRKVQLSRWYVPYRADHVATTSVVIPVVDEPEELFREVLRRIIDQGPGEVIVVINGPRNEPLEAICDDVGVRWLWTEVAGKRNAVKLGTEAASGEIVLLVDSDTIWTEGTLREIVKPFADARVGGATTRQRILAPERHVLTRWADWMESLRNEYSMPAMSVLGSVGCLPGRTIAFRRSVLIDAMPAFMTARFLGVFLEVSDDRTLTNETLKQGYRTVYQSTSVVYTDAPIRWRKMAKQQFRWSRGSQYNTMRMLPWMARNSRTLAFFNICDILLPFLLLCTVTSWLFRMSRGDGIDVFAGFLDRFGTLEGYAVMLATTLLLAAASATIRQSRHLVQCPSDLLRLPAYLLIGTFFLMPIRLLGFVRMASTGGWGTRAGGYVGERTRNPRALIPAAVAAGFVVVGTVVPA